MLHGNESIARYAPSNVAIWMVMAFQGGFLNTGGLLACHRFVSHVSGYGTMVPLTLLTQGATLALTAALVPTFFLLGAIVSGHLVDLRLRRHQRPRYYVAFALICGLLGCVCLGGQTGVFGAFGASVGGREDWLALLLTFTCGLQNGTITTVSKAVIRTTHLSGITTDLGIGLVRWMHRGQIGPEVDNEGRDNLMRAGIILFFLTGSLIGSLAFARWEFGGFAIPMLTSGVLAVGMVCLSHRGWKG